MKGWKDLTASEYTLRSAAWKHMRDACHRLHDTDDDTETILGAVEQQVRLIRHELSDDRRAESFQDAIARRD